MPFTYRNEDGSPKNLSECMSALGVPVVIEPGDNDPKVLGFIVHDTRGKLYEADFCGFQTLNVKDAAGRDLKMTLVVDEIPPQPSTYTAAIDESLTPPPPATPGAAPQADESES